MTDQRYKTGYHIEIACPGCGGELQLEEDFFVLSCRHCDSPLRIKSPDSPPAFVVPAQLSRAQVRFHVDRFLKENDLPLTDSGLELKSLYYPYWKCDALVLKKRNRLIPRSGHTSYGNGDEDTCTSLRRSEIHLAPFSVTFSAGPAMRCIPVSLGMRPGYLNLLPLSRERLEEDFDTLPATLPWSGAVEQVRSRISAATGIDPGSYGRNRTDLLSIKGVLVYFPYHLVESYTGGRYCRLVVDGITGRIPHHTTEVASPAEDSAPPADPIRFGELQVELHRCSNCGEDLPVEQSYVYLCRNCRVVNVIGNVPLASGTLSVAQASDSKPTDRLFPFWSLKLPAVDLTAGGMIAGTTCNTDRLVVPGFRIDNFEALYRLCKRMTAALPKMEMVSVDRSCSQLAPVTLPPDEGVALGRAVVYRDLLGKGSTAGSAASAFRVEAVSLFYAPFHPEHYFYVDSVIGAVTFEKSLVG